MIDIGRKEAWHLFIGRSHYDHEIVACWGFGWLPDTDIGGIPWRHHGRVRLFHWWPTWVLRRRILFNRWEIVLPVGVRIGGRWWVIA